MINANSLPRAIRTIPGISFGQKVMLGLLGLGMLLMPFSTGPGPDSFVIPFGLPFLIVAASLALPYLFVKLVNFKSNVLMLLILPFLHVVWLGFTVVSASLQLTASGARAAVEFVGFLIFAYIISVSTSGRDGKLVFYNRGLRVFVLSGGVLALYFLFSFYFAVDSYGAIAVLLSRYTGGLMSLPWGASNTIASILIMPIFVAFGLAYLGQGRQRFFSLLFAFAMFTAVLVTQSRSALASILIGIFLLLVVKRTALPIIGIVGIIIVVLLTGYFSGPDVLEIVFDKRFGDIAELSTLNGRFDIWEIALDYYMNQPLDPIGYYSSQYVFGFSPHNLVITTLIEQGVPGLFLIIALYFSGMLSSLRSSLNNKESNISMAAFFFCGIITLFIDAQFEDAQFTYPFIVYFWFFLGLLFLNRDL